MFSWIKKVAILVLMSVSNSKNSIIKNITGNFMLIPENFVKNLEKCISLKNQECKVRKKIVNSDCMTFLCKIRVNKCVESCIDVDNPYFKVCLPDIVKSVSVKVMSQKMC